MEQPQPQLINRKQFFENIKRFGLISKFTQLQVDSIDAILDEIEALKITNKGQQAYIFATAYHEAFDFTGKQTGIIQRIVPIQEGGSQAYLKSLWYYPNIGYGFVQVTHLENQLKVQKAIKKIKGIDIDVVKNPKSLLDIKVSAFALVYGLKVGMYRGKKLDDYIGVKYDFMGARFCVNGKRKKTDLYADKASEIATHASNFLRCL